MTSFQDIDITLFFALGIHLIILETTAITPITSLSISTMSRTEMQLMFFGEFNDME